MNICSVLKYEGSNNVLVWKHPDQDFNANTQLIVHESQEAVFFSNGQIADVFPAGRYTLSSQNLPFLGRIINIPTSGDTPFHCEVYYINLVDSMDLLWGTSTPITIKDPVYGLILPIGANGQFAVRVVNSQLLLTKLVGTIPEFSQKLLGQYFRGLLTTYIKDYLGKQLIDKQISFLDVNSQLREISEAIHANIQNSFDAYGIRIVNFFVTAIMVPEDNPEYIKLKTALAKKAEMSVIGYDYKEERTFDVMEKVAQNEGNAASVMGVGMGLGLGVPLGGMLGNAMAGAAQNIATSATPATTVMPAIENSVCGKCGSPLPNQAAFCSSCGEKVVRQSATVVCPHCKETVAPGKFCFKCGKILDAKCQKCGTGLPMGAVFCPNCGGRQQEGTHEEK